MRDTVNQAVLGTFIATFVYCLLVLRTIHGKVEDGVEFVPQASVTVAVLLATASIAMLIFFIHHISVSLQAPAVVAAVALMATASAQSPLTQKTGSAQVASNERTPWGDPDLQGIWPGTEMVGVPLQRPQQYGTRNVLTDEEFAVRVSQAQEVNESALADVDLAPLQSPAAQALLLLLAKYPDMLAAAAKDFAPHGVRVNAVGPGMLTDGMAARLIDSGELNDDALSITRGNIPLRRFGNAKDIAEAVCFLASTRAGFISGQKVDVDGGYGA